MSFGSRPSDRGFTLVELLIVVAIIGILAGITIPSLMRARMSGNEASAIGSLRAVYSGQQAFWSSCGQGNYSPSLQNLGSNVGTAPGFISADLSGAAPVLKSGYELDLGTNLPAAGTSCNGGSLASTFHATADPRPGGGSRYYGTNGEGTIFVSATTLVGVMPDQAAPPAPAEPLE